MACWLAPFTQDLHESSLEDFYCLCFDYFGCSLIIKGFNIGQSTGIKAEITILCVQPPTVYLDSSVLKFYLVCQIHHLLLTPGLVETVQLILKSTANAIKYRAGRASSE